MIRVYISTEGKTSLEAHNTAMDDWVSQQSVWMEDPDTHHIIEVSPLEEDSTPYYMGTYRFHVPASDEKDNLLQKCEDKLVNKCDWYRIWYHVCDHDEDESTRDGCTWDEMREWTDKDVTIPADIP